MIVYFAIMTILSILIFVFTDLNTGLIKHSDGNFPGKVFWCLIFLLIVLQGVRDVTVGGDLYESYQYRFITIEGMSWSEIFNREIRYEIGFVILSKIVYMLSGNNLHVMLLVISGFFLFSLGKLITRCSNNYFLSLFLFFSLYMYNVSMNNLRSTIAMGVVFNGLYYLIKEKYLIYLMFIIMASLFHYSMIAFIILLLVVVIKNKYVSFPLYVGLGLVFFFEFQTLFYILGNYLKTFSNYFYLSPRGGGVLLLFLCSLIIYVVTTANKKFYLDRVNIVFFKMLCCAAILQIVSLQLSYAARVTGYFMTSLLFVLPNCINYTKITLNKGKSYNIYAFMLMGWLYYIVAIINDPAATVPYKFMF